MAVQDDERDGEGKDRSKRGRQRLWTLLKWVVSLSLLAYVSTLIPLEAFRSTLRGVAWDTVALSCVLMLPVYYLNSLQMYLMTRVQGLALSVGDIFFINMITRFYELFLPTYLAGGAIRWYHYAKANNKPAEALASIVLNRVLEAFLLLVFGLAFWLLDRRADAGSLPMALGLGLLTLLSVVGYLLAFNGRFHALMRTVLARLKVPAWLAGKFGKLLDALQVYEHESAGFHGKVLALAVLRHLLTIWTLYMLVLALDLEVDLATLAWIRTVVVFAMLLPISISGFGVREATIVTLLAPFGVAPAAAVSLSLLMFARGLLFSLIGGACEAYRVLFMKDSRDRSSRSR